MSNSLHGPTKSLKESSIETISGTKETVKGVFKITKGTVKTIFNLLKLGYSTLEAGDNKIAGKINTKEHNKFIKFISNKILRLTVGTALVCGIVIGSPKNDKENDGGNKPRTEEADDKIFGIDVSEYNESNVKQFIKRSNIKEKSQKEDVRGPSFMYIRGTKETGIDPKAEIHLKTAQQFKDSTGKNFYVGTYAYFDKSKEGMSNKGIEKQVDDFIKVFNIINNKEDNLGDLVPMLDFEFRGRYPKDSKKKEIYKKAILERLKKFEEKTGIKPGLYTGTALYIDYILGDKRFAKYKIWIANYSPDHVNQDESKITQGNIEFPVDILQFTNDIGFSGLGNHEDRVDGNSVLPENFKNLIIE